MLCTEDVEHRLAGGDQVVRDDASMTAPPERFGAHNRAPLRVTQSAELGEFRSELSAHGVIGTIVKALVHSVGIHGRGNILVLAPQSSQSGHVLIANQESGQRFG